MDNKNRYGGKRTEQKQGPTQSKRSDGKYGPSDSRRSDGKYVSSEPKRSDGKYGSSDSRRSDGKYGSSEPKRSDGKYGPSDSRRSDGKYGPSESKRYGSSEPKRSDGKYGSSEPKRSDGKYGPSESKRYGSSEPKRSDGKYAPSDSRRSDGKYAPSDSRRSDGKYAPRQQKRFEPQNDTEKPRRFEPRDAEKQSRFEPQNITEQTAEMNMEPNPNIIMGRNSVREAIKNGRSIDRILVSTTRDGSLNEIITLARERNIHTEDTGKVKLDELCMAFGYNGKPGNHQGIVAYVPAVEYCNIDDILAAASAKNEIPFVIVLDEINDPHNLGSIIRSAVCAGAHGIILPKRRSAAVTAAVAKVSAGATEYANIARVPNIAAAIKELKSAGLWIAGGDMGGEPIGKADLSGPLALVIGGESTGLSRLIKEKCDYIVGIPMNGPLNSLNASVAAAVLIFEKRRQDALKPQGN